MTPHYPNAIQVPFQGSAGGSYLVSAPFRGVLHSAESKDYTPSTTSYFGHSNPPHFTVVRKSGSAKVYQHYSINVAARALANPTMSVNDVQTNRMAAIQIEICWYSAQIESLHADIRDVLRPIMRWIEGETGIQRTSPEFFGDEAYGQGGVGRMSTQAWLQFNGWCGHQHVPENQHWDPGKIDMAYLLS